MSEVRLEVLSEEEALDICNICGYKFIKVYDGKGVNSGRLMMLAETGDTNDKVFGSGVNSTVKNVEKPKNYVIYAFASNGSKMYIPDKTKCKKTVAFRLVDAKQFKDDDAYTKVKMLNKHGKYQWKLMHVQD
ncbi:MAG: hypothetical protein IJ593_00665 [Lachnospiraceae bacterium]|nr:hypothetical protein [Lachnospiraceae bacterium]